MHSFQPAEHFCVSPFNRILCHHATASNIPVSAGKLQSPDN
uniref:Uncharacterized protein n=1 Tax=Anguilla anguilla TaxID=7936 RepID=A0A0E9VU80_ANGAN